MNSCSYGYTDVKVQRERLKLGKRRPKKKALPASRRGAESTQVP